MAIAYITHSDCLLHDMGLHPEQPARLNAINDRIIASGLDMALRQYDAPLVDRELLNIAHEPLYVDRIFSMAPEEGTVWVDGDTAMNKHTLQAALRAAGAVQMGVDLVMSGEVKQVFCGVRPPGHRAETSNDMSLCFFNNIADSAYHTLHNFHRSGSSSWTSMCTTATVLKISSAVTSGYCSALLSSTLFTPALALKE